MAMTKEQAWDYAIGMLKVDGLEPSEDMLEMIGKEKRGGTHNRGDQGDSGREVQKE